MTDGTTGAAFVDSDLAVCIQCSIFSLGDGSTNNRNESTAAEDRAVEEILVKGTEEVKTTSSTARLSTIQIGSIRVDA
jgi:hypothetical protein